MPRTLAADLRRIDHLTSLPYYPQLALVLEHNHSTAAVTKRAAIKWYQSGGRDWRGVSEMLICNAKAQFGKLSKQFAWANPKDIKRAMDKATVDIQTTLRSVHQDPIDLWRLLMLNLTLNDDEIGEALYLGSAIRHELSELAARYSVSHPETSLLALSANGVFAADIQIAGLANFRVDHALSRAQCARAQKPKDARALRRLKRVWLRWFLIAENTFATGVTDSAFNCMFATIWIRFQEALPRVHWSAEGWRMIQRLKGVIERKRTVSAQVDVLKLGTTVALAELNDYRSCLQVWTYRPNVKYAEKLLRASKVSLHAGLQFLGGSLTLINLERELVDGVASLIAEMTEAK